MRRCRIKRRNEARARARRERDFGELADMVIDLPCCVAGCKRTPSDPAHVVSRGAGGEAWIVIDGVPIGNIAPLCRAHHTGGPGVLRPQHNIPLAEFEAENVFILRLPGLAAQKLGTLAEVAKRVGEWVLSEPDLGPPA